jgi:hypothetical protein
MQNVQTLVGRYIEAFTDTDTDANRRRDLLGTLYTADCTYPDAHVDLRGTDQIDGFIAQMQERFPGLTFTLGSPIDAHHTGGRRRP